MPKLSSEQEQAIVRALTAPELPWVEDLDATSHVIISALCKCSTDEAKRILEKIYVERNLIEARSEYGGTRLPDTPSRWRWIVRRN